jgi:hypothetical protein
MLSNTTIAVYAGNYCGRIDTRDIPDVDRSPEVESDLEDYRGYRIVRQDDTIAGVPVGAVKYAILDPAGAQAGVTHSANSARFTVDYLTAKNGPAAAPVPQPAAPEPHELTREEYRETCPGEDLHDVDVRHRQILNDALHAGMLIPERVMESHHDHKSEIMAPRPMPAVTNGEREAASRLRSLDIDPTGRPVLSDPVGTYEMAHRLPRGSAAEPTPAQDRPMRGAL